MGEDDFREEQRFTQRWLLLLIYSLWALTLIVPLLVLLEKKAVFFIAFLPFLIMFVVALFFRITKFQTTISDEGIYYRFFPFQIKFREIKKSDIDSIEVKTYDPIREYGGWGIRYGESGLAYSVKGNKGIYISLRSGFHFMIGTCRPDEAERFLRDRGYKVR